MAISRLEKIVLKIVNRYPSSPRAIQKKLTVSGYASSIKRLGCLYTLLHRLENQGFVSSYMDIQPVTYRGGYRQRCYQITDRGRCAIS